PRTHVLRLFLYPYDVVRFRVAFEGRGHLVLWPGIQALYPNYGYVRRLGFAGQVVVNLAGTEDDPPDRPPFLGVGHGGIVDHHMKLAGRELVDARHRAIHAQEALGLHEHERPAHGGHRLRAQQMEILRRRRGIRDLHIPLGGQLQEPLEPRARVLRAAALVAVRQQQHDARALTPLRAIGGQELVNDRLGDVHEIAVLRFPEHERVRRRGRVAVLEPEYRRLRQWAVMHLERAG